MELTDFQNGKHKCNVCGKAITANNLEDHKPCLTTAHEYNGDLSYNDMLGLALKNKWLWGWGKDMRNYNLSFNDIEGEVVTEDPSLKIAQYALAIAVAPKTRKPKDEPVVPEPPVG